MIITIVIKSLPMKFKKKNSQVILHFINLCTDRKNKYPKYKVPDFHLIEKDVTEILREKYSD